MIIGNKNFDVAHHTYIMGILNVTPDSFSDGGKWHDRDAALKHAETMITEGADLIDIGGESTRPGHVQITEQEEIERVLPIIEAVKSHFEIPVSIDTYKASVAEAAIKAGADLVNDIWGLQYDSRMAEVIQTAQVPCCLMHNRKKADYQHFETDFISDLEQIVARAKKAGIPDDKIILDPGVGFGKSYQNNLSAVANVGKIHQLGYPILLATSRKGFIDKTLHVSVDDRLEGTLATTVIGVLNQCAFIRVHDVKENKRVIQMTEAIMAQKI
ncbi:dihydropteroate synthase [Vagococcus elongatus]|uniref:Dihydropteroate synthase n=1 Tax=Vagococcus elongatus TaxID=180344 RepID=A0A430AZT9_9ENTE|nr:dihydropteroate synthase [Vagococcus elongatus]RSU13585.1 dihydropteroate synthase [Vagococcus elongatus]